jgi:hypothetical protein
MLWAPPKPAQKQEAPKPVVVVQPVQSTSQEPEAPVEQMPVTWAEIMADPDDGDDE